MEAYRVNNAHEIPTPALLIYKDHVAHNIRSIGERLGGYERFRPHIKTHKMSRVAQMQMDAGISKFKCATPKEAAMLAAVGVTDILISYHIVGANIERVIGLQKTHPKVDLKVIADDRGAVIALSEACNAANTTLGVLIDMNTGMDRTGIAPGQPTQNLARTIADSPGLTFEGLHVYDGHSAESDPEKREQIALESISKAVDTRQQIETGGLPVNLLVASGSPGAEHTAKVPEVDEVSPGTWIFWDTGYGDMMDAPFTPAGLVLSSVISTPGPDLITLDAGSKGVAPDTPVPHFRPLGLPETVEFVRRNEEHQVLRLPENTPRPNVGDQLYLIPRHICTTVNLYDEVHVIDSNNTFVETWSVDARGH